MPQPTPARPAAELRAANLLYKAVSLPLEKVCRFVLVAVAARMLGEAPFGTFQFAATATTLLALCTEMGLGVWSTRALARAPERAAIIVGTSLRVRALAAGPYVVLTGAAALAVGPGPLRAAMILLGVAALADAVVDQLSAALRGYDRFGDEARLTAGRAVLVAAAGIAAVVRGRSVGWLAGGVALASLVAAGYGLALVRRRFRLPTALGGEGFDPALARTAVRQGLPIWLAGMLALLYFRGDTLLVRVFAGDAALGAYSAAYKIFEGSMLVPAILLAVAFPPLARAHADRDRQRRWERSLAAVLLTLGLAVGSACHLGAGAIIAVAFGPRFAAGVPSLLVLSWGLPLLYLNYGLNMFLIARDLGRRNLTFAALMLVINVALNLYLIPRRGGIGAAWATVLTEAALTACCLATLAADRRTPAAASGDRWSG